jgi:hypothetical protein
LAGALPAVSGNGRGWERAHNTFQGAVRLTGEGLLRDEAAAGVFHGKEGGDGRARREALCSGGKDRVGAEIGRGSEGEDAAARN